MDKQKSNIGGLVLVAVGTLLWTFSWAAATNVWSSAHSSLVYLGFSMAFLRFAIGSFTLLAAVVVRRHKRENEVPKAPELNTEVRHQAIETMYWIVVFKVAAVLVTMWLLSTVYFAGCSTITVAVVFTTLLYAILSLYQFAYIRRNLAKTSADPANTKTPVMCTSDKEA